MTRSMGRPLALVRLFACLAMTAGVVVGVSPAFACSCAEMDVESSLPEADGAFVGTYIDRSGIGGGSVAYTFDVERVVKGDFGPTAVVRTSADGASCGLEFYGDRRTGLLLHRADDGVWESSLCSMVQPADLLAVGGDHPPDVDVEAVGAGWSWTTKMIAAGAALLLLLVVVLLLTARVAGRRPPRPIEPA